MLLVWCYCVVPFAMKVVGEYVDGGELYIGNFESFRIFPFVEFSTHGQAGVGGGGGNEFNDGTETAQGFYLAN